MLEPYDLKMKTRIIINQGRAKGYSGRQLTRYAERKTRQMLNKHGYTEKAFQEAVKEEELVT